MQFVLFCWKVRLVIVLHGLRTGCAYGYDTQSRNLCKKLVQVDLYKRLDRLTWFLVQDFPCTSFLHRIQHSSIPYKKLTCTWQEWWALIGRLPITAMFSFCCVDVVDNLLYNVNIVCSDLFFKLIWVIRVKMLCSHGVVDRKYWESYLFRPRTPVFVWCVVSRTCTKIWCKKLAQETCASFLRSFLDCVSPPLGLHEVLLCTTSLNGSQPSLCKCGEIGIST